MEAKRETLILQSRILKPNKALYQQNLAKKNKNQQTEQQIHGVINKKSKSKLQKADQNGILDLEIWEK